MALMKRESEKVLIADYKRTIHDSLFTIHYLLPLSFANFCVA